MRGREEGKRGRTGKGRGEEAVERVKMRERQGGGETNILVITETRERENKGEVRERLKGQEGEGERKVRVCIKQARMEARGRENLV